MSLTTRVLLGLVGGFVLGLALTSVPSAAGPVLAIATPIGTIFVNLIRMTVIPLVIAMVISAAAALARKSGVGGKGVREPG